MFIYKCWKRKRKLDKSAFGGMEKNETHLYFRMNDALEHYKTYAYSIYMFAYVLHFPYIHTNQRGKNSLILFFFLLW